MLCCFLGLPATAQEQITPDAFLDQADQRTLTFENFPGGSLVGVEQFLSRTRTVWSRDDGTCTYGKIEVRGPQICFFYEDLPVQEHCWVPFQSDDGLVVVSTSRAIQKVTKITRKPVVCEDQILS